MNELKTFEPKIGGSFQAAGKIYHIEKSISIERYTLFQRFELELGYSTTFQQLFNALNKSFELLNKAKPAEAAVEIYNAMRGVTKLEEKEPYVLKYCALFINAEDEDRATITDDIISEKIKNWREEGYDMAPFFQLALNSIPGFIESYKRGTQDSLGSNPKDQE